MPFGDLTGYDRVIVPENEGVVLRLILQDAELSVYIILHLIVITVQMIRCYIQYNSDIRFKVVHIIQLETAQLDHVDRMWIFRNLKRQAVSDIPGQAHVHARFFQYMIRKHRRCRLAVATRDANHLRVRIPSGKLDLGDDRRTLLLQ